MKILEELRKAKGFHTFIATTYEVDLLWFESLLLRQLQRNGVKKFLVLVDETRLAESVAEFSDRLFSSGKSYILQPVSLPVSFHPKIYLLIGDRRLRLYVGSGNLTRGGFGKNLEVFEKWNIDGDTDAIPPVFSAVRNYLSRLLKDHLKYFPPVLQRTVDVVFSSDLFGKPHVDNPAAEIWFSPGALFERLPRYPAHGDQLIIVSPYFDERGDMAVDIAKHFQAPSFEVIIDTRKTNLTPQAVQKIREAGGTISALDAAHHPRHMHAKLLFAKGGNWSIGIAGSANASKAAWLGANGEAIAVRTGEAATEVYELISTLKTRELSARDIEKLEKQAAEELKKTDEISGTVNFPGPKILYAKWVSLSRIEIIALKNDHDPTSIEIHGKVSRTIRQFSCVPFEGQLFRFEFSCPDEINRGQVLALAFACDGVMGNTLVVHDEEEITHQGSPVSKEREYLQRLLGEENFDPDNARRLLEMYLAIRRQRAETSGQVRKVKGTQQTEIDTLDDQEHVPDIVQVDFGDLGPDDEGAVHGPEQHLYSGAMTVGMMNRLLFGGLEGEVDDTVSESEVGDGEDDTTTTTDRTKSRQPCSSKQHDDFISASERAREYYLENLRHYAERGPLRLVDDLQLLAAPLHYMLRNEGISAMTFRNEMVRLLRPLIGGPDNYLIVSLLNLEERDRQEIWEKTPLLLITFLLTYNACLANNDTALGSRKISIHFPDVRPVLWLRHLVGLIPDIGKIDLDLIRTFSIPKLRWGIFWIADCFPGSEEQFPFAEFIVEMVKKSELVNKIDNEFEASFGRLRGMDNILISEDYDEPIVSRTTLGTLGIGWAEEDVRRAEKKVVIVANSAFQAATPHSCMEKMKFVDINSSVPLFRLEEMAEKMSDNDMLLAMQYLREIAP